MNGFDVDQARNIVAAFFLIIFLLIFVIWYASTGFKPSVDQTANFIAENIVPTEINIINWVANNLGGTIIGAFILIILIWFFFGDGRRR